ncbi:WGxxGxxG family protein [Phormidium sp. CCY1219]|uniref:WGxxGxxG family protein n=1 Tax=Phormidium sp. CCY1219 TaxID=2886104 RepID=UPI002D1F47FD|nr:WGxxGxxG family protein [Phormidium sp. CCY1219]MEB3826545.1 hypothetical protein [Phormidium sp. CCY1219]
MKLTNKFSKVISAGVLGASLAFLPFNLPASAQVDDVYETPREEVAELEYEDNDNWGAWGLLGLFGLLGLAGLGGKKRHEEHTVYADPAREREGVGTRSTYR